MGVIIATADPEALLKSILARFDREPIPGWAKDGKCLSLTAPEWSSKAYLRPIVQPGQLAIGVVPTEDHDMSNDIYAVYLGRFIEMLLAHFSDLISSVQVVTRLAYPDLMHWSAYRQSDSADEQGG
jgi:hypothetical protein